MAVSDILIGQVLSIKDEDKGIVEFTIPNYVDSAYAYPAIPERKILKGDEILLFKPPSALNSLWCYLVLNKSGAFTLNAYGSEIVFKKGKVFISSDEIHLGKYNGSVGEPSEQTDFPILFSDFKSSMTEVTGAIKDLVSATAKATAVTLPSGSAKAVFTPLSKAVELKLAKAEEVLDLIDSRVVKIQK